MSEHRFETAGLGKAPFRVLGVEVRVGPIRYPNGLEVGAPGQPMGCCQYCGQGIAECWMIGSSDGKTFMVGCDCVRKTGDAGLRSAMAPHLKAKRAKAAKARLDRAEAALPVDALRAKPHPHIPGKTLLDYVDYLLERGGQAGRTRACRIIEANLEES